MPRRSTWRRTPVMTDTPTGDEQLQCSVTRLKRRSSGQRACYRNEGLTVSATGSQDHHGVMGISALNMHGLQSRRKGTACVLASTRTQRAARQGRRRRIWPLQLGMTTQECIGSHLGGSQSFHLSVRVAARISGRWATTTAGADRRFADRDPYAKSRYRPTRFAINFTANPVTLNQGLLRRMAQCNM